MFMFRTKTLYSTHTKRTVCSHFEQTLYSTHPMRSTFTFCTETPYFTHIKRSVFMFHTETLCTLRGQCSCFIQRHSGVEHFGDAGVWQEADLGDEGGDVVVGRDIVHQVEQPQGLVVPPVAQDGWSVAHHLQLIGISCKQKGMGGGGYKILAPGKNNHRTLDWPLPGSVQSSLTPLPPEFWYFAAQDNADVISIHTHTHTHMHTHTHSLSLSLQKFKQAHTLIPSSPPPPTPHFTNSDTHTHTPQIQTCAHWYPTAPPPPCPPPTNWHPPPQHNLPLPHTHPSTYPAHWRRRSLPETARWSCRSRSRRRRGCCGPWQGRPAWRCRCVTWRRCCSERRGPPAAALSSAAQCTPADTSEQGMTGFRQSGTVPSTSSPHPPITWTNVLTFFHLPPPPPPPNSHTHICTCACTHTHTHIPLLFFLHPKRFFLFCIILQWHSSPLFFVCLFVSLHPHVSGVVVVVAVGLVFTLSSKCQSTIIF